MASRSDEDHDPVSDLATGLLSTADDVGDTGAMRLLLWSARCLTIRSPSKSRKSVCTSSLPLTQRPWRRRGVLRSHGVIRQPQCGSWTISASSFASSAAVTAFGRDDRIQGEVLSQLGHVSLRQMGSSRTAVLNIYCGHILDEECGDDRAWACWSSP
jgi:hypothetical protein